MPSAREAVAPAPSTRGYASMPHRASVALLSEAPDDDEEDGFGRSSGGRSHVTAVLHLSDASCYKKWRGGWWTVVPDGNPLIDLWDVFVIAALLATAFVLPYEVAIVTRPTAAQEMFDMSVNGIFIVDIVLTFNLAYTGAAFRTLGIWERDPLIIARYYMSWPFSDNFRAGWFWPDVATVLPWEMILKGGQGASSVRMVRVVRLLRMFRLVRVVKLFTRGQTKYGFSFAMVRMIRCLGITILLLHWLACCWAHVGLNAAEYGASQEDCWLSRTHTAKVKPVADFTGPEAYSLALYFCTVILTTVGFGDILPINMVETVLVTFTVFMVGLTWAWIVANVVGVIGQMDGFSVSFNQAMDDLNTLMVYQDVDKTLQKRVRRHMHEAFGVHQSKHHWLMTQSLSPTLQGELAVVSGKGAVCNCIWYFRRLTRGHWLTELVLQFTPDLYSARELIIDRSSVSVIRRGCVVKKGKVMTKDGIFGEDMILTTEVLRDTTCPRTLNIVEVLKLSRAGLRTVCERHENVNLCVRRAQTRLAVWRSLVLLADKLRFRQERGLDWDYNTFRELCSKQRPGFVETSGAKAAQIDVPPNPTLEGISNEIREVTAAVREAQLDTQGRLDSVARSVEALDQRTRRLEAASNATSAAACASGGPPGAPHAPKTA